MSKPHCGGQGRHDGNQTDDLPPPDCKRCCCSRRDPQLVADPLLPFRHLQDSFGGALNHLFVIPQVARGR